MASNALAAIRRVEQLKRTRDQLIADRRRRPRADRRRLARMRLVEAIPAMSPDCDEPTWLAPLLVKCERLEGGHLRITVSVPPRHGKSQTILHWIAWALLRNPKLRILYVSHTATFATRQSKDAKRLARAAGVEVSRATDRSDEWETVAGGGLVARGVDGDITGRGFDVILIDDPIKGHKDAESSVRREQLFETITKDIFTRVTPDGSIMVVHTRWHVDDIAGRLEKATQERERDATKLGSRWERINLPAIAENDNDPLGRSPGEALWPEVWPAHVLEERRGDVGEYAWAALYQGHPRPKGGSVFGEPTFYEPGAIPKDGWRLGYGIDLAYTAATHADYSVLVQGVRVGEKLYITGVWRMQCAPELFAETVKQIRSAKPGRVVWHASGTEKSGALFLRREGVPVVMKRATTDKFQRAIPFAARWNRGLVLVPSTVVNDNGVEEVPDWLHAFLGELGDFTGVQDLHDDQVDGGASLHDGLFQGSSTSSGGGMTGRPKADERRVA